MRNLSATEKLVEELLSFVDDGTMTEDERSLLTQAIQSNSLTEDEINVELLQQLKAAFEATKLPCETQTTDKTLIQSIVQQLHVQIALSEASQASGPQLGQQKNDDFSLAGQTIGNYRILKLIGRGGMGDVYEAADQLLHRHVALKVMLPAIAARPENRARFLREARAAASVEHDHICPIYQVGEQQGTAFIAMPLLAGETLESRLKQQRLSYLETIDLIQQVAIGLDAAHRAGLIHRDIKPANVWLEARNGGAQRLRLLDFGLAQMETEEPGLTQPGSIMGTPSYMAPEQARGEAVDARTDLFSVGAMMYELLTGRKAFEGKTPTAVLSSIMVDHPKAPATIALECPQCLSDLAMRLIEKNPNARLPNAAELIQELARCRAQCSFASQRERPETSSTIHALPIANSEVLSPPHATTATANKQTRSSWFWPLLIAAGLAGMACASVLVLQTPSGTLIVETSDDARLIFQKGELQVLDEAGRVAYRLTAANPTENLAPGKYHVKVTGADGLKLNTDEFVIHRQEKTILRVTTGPAEKSANTAIGGVKSNSPLLNSFQGKALIATDFKDPREWPLPLIDDATMNSRIENGLLFYKLKAHDPAKPFLLLPMVARLNRGAFAVRCKALHGAVFFNFCVRRTAIHTRGLSLGINNGKWTLYVQRFDWEDETWKSVKETMVATSPITKPGLAKDEWLDLAFRWSDKDYAIWMNGERIAGGDLPSGELTIGYAVPMQIGLRSNPVLLPQIEVDAMGLWDQSDISFADAQIFNAP